MASFTARLRMGRARLPLGVEVDILHERMTVTAGDQTVANWPLERLEVAAASDGFHIKVDDEEIVLTVTDPTRFAAELGVATERQSRLAVATSRTAPSEISPVNGHLDRFRRTNGEIPPGLATDPTFVEEQVDEARRRISEIAKDLTSDSVSPVEAFARWLSLLKEINRQHGEGSMPTHLYFELNSQLLDLIPDSIPNRT
ncbi:MAG: hypothetical protein ACRDX9_10175 [Acidimicrobiia bacterium]